MPTTSNATLFVALVVSRQGAPSVPDAALQTLKQQLANFKIPEASFALKELPRNTKRKVQKQALRERYADLFVRT